MLQMRGVSYTYPGWPPVVDGVDWAMATGEIHCLVGRSGCGKTTLLKLAAGLMQPDAGTVMLAQQPVESPHVGDVPQHEQHPGGNVPFEQGHGVDEHMGVGAPGQLLGRRPHLADTGPYHPVVETELRQRRPLDLGHDAEAVQRRGGIGRAVLHPTVGVEQHRAVAHTGQFLERVLGPGEREVPEIGRAHV